MYARTAGLAGRALLLLLLAAPLLTQVQQPGASLCLLPFFPLAGSGGLHCPDLGQLDKHPKGLGASCEAAALPRDGAGKPSWAGLQGWERAVVLPPAGAACLLGALQRWPGGTGVLSVLSGAPHFLRASADSQGRDWTSRAYCLIRSRVQKSL